MNILNPEESVNTSDDIVLKMLPPFASKCMTTMIIYSVLMMRSLVIHQSLTKHLTRKMVKTPMDSMLSNEREDAII